MQDIIQRANIFLETNIYETGTYLRPQRLPPPQFVGNSPENLSLY